MLEVINPATGAVIATYYPHTPAQIEGRLARAVAAQRSWAERPLAERCAALVRLAAVLRAGRDTYARLIVSEMGKPLVEAEAEIEKSALTCECYAEQAPHSAAWLLKPAAIARHDRGGGAATTPLLTAGLGARTFINGYTEFQGGARISFHFRNCEESVMPVEGRAIFDIDGQEFALAPQDVTYIRAGVPHRFRNAAATDPLKLLWSYDSADATRTLVETGETRPITAEHRTQS